MLHPLWVYYFNPIKDAVRYFGDSVYGVIPDKYSEGAYYGRVPKLKKEDGYHQLYFSKSQYNDHTTLFVSKLTGKGFTFGAIAVG